MNKIDFFKHLPNEDQFSELVNRSPWKELDIANVAWYVDYDVSKTELILSTASKLGIHWMAICKLIDKLKK